MRAGGGGGRFGLGGWGWFGGAALLGAAIATAQEAAVPRAGGDAGVESLAAALAAAPAGVAPGEAESGALLVRAQPEAKWQPAPEVATAVEIGVVGLVARARVEQRFRNPSSERVEAVYVFPLPEGAAVDRLELESGGRRIRGEVRAREQARRTYERARAEGRRGSLLEQARPNLFRVEVAGIDPGGEVTVRIEYQELVRYDAGSFRLRFPLVVGARFTPPIPFERAAGDEPPPAVPPAPAGARRPVALRVSIDAGLPLERLESSTHALRVRRGDGGAWLAELAEGTVPADRDLELHWRPRPSAAPRVARFEEEAGGERYAALLFVPPPPEAAAPRPPRDLIVVLDTSGSMEGTSIEQARRAVKFALDRLEPDDRFNVIVFSDAATALFEEVVPADPRALAHARDWVDRLAAGGGTNLRPALELALDAPAGGGALRQVLFVTDGCVGNEEELFALLGERLGESRLFTVGIGSAPNSWFMTRAAELGRGSHTYVGRVEEVGAKMAVLLEKLERPVATDLELEWDDPAAESYPPRPPDLYAGEPILVVARLDRPDAGVRLRGRREGQAFEQAFAPAAPRPSAGLAKLWARRKIDALEASTREPGAPLEAIRAEIVALALAHSLLSRHTSFVAVEELPSAGGPPEARRDVGALRPAGWTLGGELPQGGTEAARLLLAAIGAGVAGLLLHRIGRREREP